MSIMVLAHVISALASAGLILAVLALPKGRRAHRLLGRLAAAGMALTALTAFGIQARGHFSWLHLMSVLILVVLVHGIRQAKQGRMRQHRRAMLGAAGGLVVAGLVAILAPGRSLHGMLFG